MSEGSSYIREEYVRQHGSERILRLLRRKLLARMQRRVMSAGLRRRLARWFGVNVIERSGVRSAWIGSDVYLDDTFPELITLHAGCVIALRSMLICHDDASRRLAPIVIEEGAYVGAGAIVLPGVTIEKGAVVAAGAVVAKSVSAGETWGGVPARKIEKSRSEIDEE